MWSLLSISHKNKCWGAFPLEWVTKSAFLTKKPFIISMNFVALCIDITKNGYEIFRGHSKLEKSENSNSKRAKKSSVLFRFGDLMRQKIQMHIEETNLAERSGSGILMMIASFFSTKSWRRSSLQAKKRSREY